MDRRAPALLVLVCHLIAYLLLDRLVGEALGPRARLFLAIFYWLNPWRLYQSAWIDNSNYVFLTGAVHALSSYRQRSRPHFGHSALLVATVGLTVQLHLDAVLLVFASLLLWIRGYWKPHWGGVALGSAITVLALVPFLVYALEHPEVVPGAGAGESQFGQSLLAVWPPFKGILYWLRYASLAVSKRMLVFDFTPSFGAGVDSVLTPLMLLLGFGIGYATFAIPLLANAFLVKRFRKVGRGQPSRRAPRDWLRGYAVWVFAACFLANALSPTIIMWWHNLIALHAAVLPVVLLCDTLARTRRAELLRRVCAVHAGLSAVLLLGMAFGADQYRVGGRGTQADSMWEHPMPRDLRLDECCGVVFDLEPATNWRGKEGEYFYRTYLLPYAPKPPAAAPEAP